MSYYDILYASQVKDILEYGYSDAGEDVRPKWADGTPAYTKSIVSKQLKFNGTDVPILTTKRVPWKSAIHELLWFYVKRTSDTTYLRENNVTIWDEWTREDGSIGRAYGYQLGKPIIEEKTPFMQKRTLDGGWTPSNSFAAVYTNQVHKLIKGLKENPSSRRHIISLWNIDDLHDMALAPCMWHNQWLVKGGQLHGIIGIRSNDCGLGQPLNVFQMYVLQRMLAQVTGYEVGTLTFNINDCHIYSRHEEALKEQMSREPFDAPSLWLNPDVKKFDNFTIDDFKLLEYSHHPTLPMEVAI